MGEVKSVRLEKHQLDAIEEMVDDDVADNQSEALRHGVDVGLAELGYGRGVRNDTQLRWAIQESARALGWAGITWLGATFMFSLRWRLPALALFIASITCLGADRLLEAHEPGVSRRLVGIFGGEQA